MLDQITTEPAVNFGVAQSVLGANEVSETRWTAILMAYQGHRSTACPLVLGRRDVVHDVASVLVHDNHVMKYNACTHNFEHGDGRPKATRRVDNVPSSLQNAKGSLYFLACRRM